MSRRHQETPASIAPGAPVSRWRRFSRGLARTFLAFLLLLLLASGLLVGAVLWVLMVPSGQEILRKHTVERVSALFPSASLELGHVGMDLSGDILLTDLRLLDSGAGELAGLGSLRIRWNPSELLVGRLHVTSLSLDYPRAALSVSENGDLNLWTALGIEPDEAEPDSPASPWEGLPVDLVLDRFSVSGAAFSFSNGDQVSAVHNLELVASLKGQERNVELRDLALGGRLAIKQSGSTTLDSQLALAGSVLFLDGDLELAALRASLASFTLALDGRISALETAPAMALSLEMEGLDPAEFQGLAGDLGVDGPFGAAFQVTGPMDQIQVDGELDTPSGSLGLNALLDLEARDIAWNARLELNELALHDFVSAISEPSILNGRIVAGGEGTQWPSGLQARATLELEPGMLWGEPLAGLQGSLDLHDGALNLNSLEVDTALASLITDARVVFPQMTTRASFRLAAPDLSRLARFGVEDLRGRGQVRGNLVLNPAGDSLEGSVDGNLDLKGLAYGDIANLAVVKGSFHAGFS